MAALRRLVIDHPVANDDLTSALDIFAALAADRDQWRARAETAEAALQEEIDWIAAVEEAHRGEDERPVPILGRRLWGGSKLHAWWIQPGSEGPDGPTYRRSCSHSDKATLSQLMVVTTTRSEVPCHHPACVHHIEEARRG